MVYRIYTVVITVLTVLSLSGVYAQEQAKVGCVAFYNLENLFDTIDSPNTHDSEFTPEAGKQWNTRRYQKKLENLSDVISQLGTEITPDGAAVIGLCEVENRSVLEDLVKTEKLKDRNYQIVHYESPDYRGIDVALLYQPKYFQLEDSKTFKLEFADNPGYRTRDQLLVSGKFDGDPMHFIVNHWPSRRGGEKKSRPKRNQAAQLCKSIIDQVKAEDPNAKVIVMGDLNDDPVSPSVKKHLKASANVDGNSKTGMYNPMYKLYKKGVGTLAYRDNWNLFDQMILTPAFMKKGTDGYTFHSVKVFNKNFLLQKEGAFKGYPFRTYVGNNFKGGYSDHFPVYIFLVKQL